MHSFTDHSVITIRERDDVTLYVVYANNYFTTYGTRRRLGNDDDSDENRVDFYRSFHYAQFEVMVCYIKLMFNKLNDKLEIAQNVLQCNDGVPVHDLSVDEIFYKISTKNEIFAYDSLKFSELDLKNLLGSIFYF